MSGRVDWPAVLDRLAEEIRASGLTWTLRQAYYVGAARLGLFPLTLSSYKGLSSATAKARRDGRFPAFYDGTRTVFAANSCEDPSDFLDQLETAYRRDLTEGQDVSVWLGVEKATLQEQVREWVAGYGIPVVVLRGFGSQSYLDDISHRIRDDGRPALCLYVGDHDASGQDIERDLRERCAFDEIRRIALTPDLVATFGLPAVQGKASDSRWPAFARRFALDPHQPVQWEVEALAVADLRTLVVSRVEAELDLSLIEAAWQRQEVERHELAEHFATFGGTS